MPVSALPSTTGVGELGWASYQWIDIMKENGVKIWQILPLNPVGYGNSPYQPYSSCAGDEIYISLDLLFEAGLLDKKPDKFRENAKRVDYTAVRAFKESYLREAFEKFVAGDGQKDPAYVDFMSQDWVYTYGVFRALKLDNNGDCWNDWEADYKNWSGGKSALSENVEKEAEYQCFIQYIFYTQWMDVKRYANEAGVEVMGDVPFYVGLDSVDVWSGKDNFLLDTDGRPIFIAGVPPDYFSATGQLWGNPLYNWDKLKELNYKWWIDRVKANLSTCDIIRIDHFRGFDEYWAVPYGDKTAENGTWCPGPRMDLFNAIKNELGELPIIAEDLGTMTQGVIDLREATGFPGMKILGFAFDSKEENDYLPHTYTKNCVVYTGTHDNDTLIGWFTKANEDDKQFARDYLNSRSDDEIHWDAIRGAWSSVASMAIVPIQDFLGLGSEARINTPGLASGNWQWRLKEGVLTDELAERIAKLTKVYSR